MWRAWGIAIQRVMPVIWDVVFATRFLRDKVNNTAFYCHVGMEIVALRPHIKINRGRLACVCERRRQRGRLTDNRPEGGNK